MAGLKLELDERAKQKLMEYLAEKISRRSLREGFALPLNHRFFNYNGACPHIFVDFSSYQDPALVQYWLIF